MSVNLTNLIYHYKRVGRALYSRCGSKHITRLHGKNHPLGLKRSLDRADADLSREICTLEDESGP
jgi:hypothetical protein